MILWPEKISNEDAAWQQACALLQVLALDPRRKVRRGFPDYVESADELLVRPDIWVDKRLVPAPYYSFSLRFNVSVSVHGSIFIADTEQVEEFKRVVNAALQSPLTVAERKRWEADNEFIKCCAANDPMASVFELAGSEESRKADRYYHEIREAIAAPRRLIDYGHSSLCQHEEVLDGLIRLGATLLKAA